MKGGRASNPVFPNAEVSDGSERVEGSDTSSVTLASMLSSSEPRIEWSVHTDNTM